MGSWEEDKGSVGITNGYSTMGMDFAPPSSGLFSEKVLCYRGNVRDVIRTCKLIWIDLFKKPCPSLNKWE